MHKSLTKINYIYIFIVLIWAPLQSYILQFDGMGRTLFFLTIPVFTANILYGSFRKLLKSKPIVFWGFWVIYSGINSFFKGSQFESKDTIFFIGNFIVPYIVMIIVCKEYLNNSSKLLKFLTLTVFLYVLMGVSDLNLNVLGSERIIDEKLGNLLPLNIVLLIFFICLRLSRKELKLRNVVIMLMMLLLLIVFSGTRKALGGALIIIISTIFSFINLKSYKTTLIAIVFSVLLFFGYQYIMVNTIIGDRMNEVEEQGMMYNTTVYPILNLLGDRSYQYILGWEVFTKNPLTGIGLSNYRANTLSKHGIHSEYIVQLAECGLIGSMLFLLFILWIWLNLFRCWKDYPQLRNHTLIIVGGFAAILFIGLTVWIYSFPLCFAGYGIIIAFLKPNKDLKNV